MLQDISGEFALRLRSLLTLFALTRRFAPPFPRREREIRPFSVREKGLEDEGQGPRIEQKD